MAQERTFHELASPIGNQAPLCITYIALGALLSWNKIQFTCFPSLEGVRMKTHKYLKEFYVVCLIIRPQGIFEDHTKLCGFPFSLNEAVKDWLFYLSPDSITTWTIMVRAFLEKYFPTSKAIGIKREISGIKKKDSGELYEYWKRFKRMCTSCSQYNISDQSLI